MSHLLLQPDEDDPWSDPHVVRAEFQRRLAERGIFVRLPRTDKEWVPPVPFPVSADEASATVIRMRRGVDEGYFFETAIVGKSMSTPLPINDDEGPWADPDVRRAEFRRRLAEKGIFVGLPRTDKEWVAPIPLPVSADEASEMVIRMRRGED